MSVFKIWPEASSSHEINDSAPKMYLSRYIGIRGRSSRMMLLNSSLGTVSHAIMGLYLHPIYSLSSRLIADSQNKLNSNLFFFEFPQIDLHRGSSKYKIDSLLHLLIASRKDITCWINPPPRHHWLPHQSHQFWQYPQYYIVHWKYLEQGIKRD